MSSRTKAFKRGQRIYLEHVLGLIAPGSAVPTFPADQLKPQSLDAWTNDDLGHMIEEGRRQSDRQQADLERIRSRAQWLFTVAAGALAALGAGLVSSKPSVPLIALWLVGMLLLVYGIGGAAAILTVRADFAMIHTAVLSGVSPPVDRELAKSYSRMMSDGENTVATRLTVFRQAVVFSLSGGYLGLLAAVLAG